MLNCTPSLPPSLSQARFLLSINFAEAWSPETLACSAELRAWGGAEWMLLPPVPRPRLPWDWAASPPGFTPAVARRFGVPRCRDRKGASGILAGWEMLGKVLPLVQKHPDLKAPCDLSPFPIGFEAQDGELSQLQI